MGLLKADLVSDSGVHESKEIRASVCPYFKRCVCASRSLRDHMNQREPVLSVVVNEGTLSFIRRHLST
jgi:hypothetical protein